MLRRILKKWLASGYPVQMGGQRYGAGVSLELATTGDYDYRTMAGDRYDNSVVLSCIRFLAGNASQARLVLERAAGGGKWVEVEKHPVLSLLARPNKYYSANAIWEATILSDAVDGNAYWLVQRSNSGKPVEFYYLSHTQVRPVSESAYELIQGYEVQIGGQWLRVPYEDIIHFRRGIDPRNPRKGLSRIGAVLREICTDNEGATYAAAILRNMGVPGVIFTPKGDAVRDATPEQKARLKESWRGFTSDMRGEPFVAPYPMEVLKPGFSPEDLVLDKVRAIPAARICAAFLIDPLVVHLPSESKTYSNYGEAERQALNHALLPMLEEFASCLEVQLFPAFADLDPARYRLRWDTSAIQALQDDIDEMVARLREDFKANTITRAEFRIATGRAASSADNVYYSDTLLGQGGAVISANDASARLAAFQASEKALASYVDD